MEQLINKNSRIEVVDALRGFAVMAIILVHNLEHFIFPVYPTDSPNWLNILDQGIYSTEFFLFLREKPMPFSLFCSDLHSTYKPTIKKSEAKISVTAFYGV